MSRAAVDHWTHPPTRTTAPQILCLRPDKGRADAERRQQAEGQRSVNTSAPAKTYQLDGGLSPAELVGLVERARGGDREAFGRVVGALQRPLYFAVMRITRHQHDARDIVQRAFLKAWEKLPELEDPQKFRSWLFTIGINLARNLRRDEGRRQHEPMDERPIATTEPSAPEALSRAQQRRQLRAALDALPPRQKEVVTLRIDAELPFQEIGEALDCTAATARVNFHHGMKRLRELLAHE